MNSIIKELWYGNILPQEAIQIKQKEAKELLSYITRHQENLDKSFTAEQRVLFEKLQDCWSEYSGYSEEAIFEYAFKLGMQIAIEVLSQ